MQRNILDAPFEDELQLNLEVGESILWKGSKEKEDVIKKNTPKKKSLFILLYEEIMKDKDLIVYTFLIISVFLIFLIVLFIANIKVGIRLILLAFFFKYTFNGFNKIFSYLKKPTRYFITQKRIIVQNFRFGKSQVHYFDRSQISKIKTIKEGKLGTIYFQIENQPTTDILQRRFMDGESVIAGSIESIKDSEKVAEILNDIKLDEIV